MAVIKVVLNHWGLAVVGDHDSGSTGFPDIDWDSPAWRAGDQHSARDALDLSAIGNEIDDAIRTGFRMPATQFARGRVIFDG